MARLLIIFSGDRQGELSGVFPDSHVFGRMEDYDAYVSAFGSDQGWRNTFVIVDVPGMTIEEARDLAAVVADTTVVQDPDTGTMNEFQTIRFNCKGWADLAKLDASLKGGIRQQYRQHRKVTIDKATFIDAITLRT